MELLEELVEEILLRIPPDEPAYFVDAGLVCKSWCRILSDRGIHRRYRMFHRTPPLLGYFHNLGYDEHIPRFVRTSTVSPFTQPPLGNTRQWQILDCRHGRVLARILIEPYPLVIWDPVTGHRQELSLPPVYRNGHWYRGAVLCAADGDGCGHLDCHDGPFIVVYMVADANRVVRATVYSSLTKTWGEPSSVTVHGNNSFDLSPSLLARGALYFGICCESVVKYDLRGHRLSVIDRPGGVFADDMIMMTAEDGGLAFVIVSDGCIYFWTRQKGSTAGANGGWVRQHKAAGLKTQLLGGCRWVRQHKPRDVVGFVESTSTIFINRTAGVFAVDLNKPRQARKVGEERGPYSYILPYTSFYTPDIAKGRLSPP